MAMMSRIIGTLEKSHSGLFEVRVYRALRTRIPRESARKRTGLFLQVPTGCGKTLAILCSTLAWQESYNKKIEAANAQAAVGRGADVATRPPLPGVQIHPLPARAAPLQQPAGDEAKPLVPPGSPPPPVLARDRGECAPHLERPPLAPVHVAASRAGQAAAAAGPGPPNPFHPLPRSQHPPVWYPQHQPVPPGPRATKPLGQQQEWRPAPQIQQQQRPQLPGFLPPAPVRAPVLTPAAAAGAPVLPPPPIAAPQQRQKEGGEGRGPILPYEALGGFVR